MIPQRKLLLVFTALIKLVSPTGSKKAAAINNSGVTPEALCGVWIKEPEGGSFASPNYPDKYPPDRECTYIIEDPDFKDINVPLSLPPCEFEMSGPEGVVESAVVEKEEAVDCRWFIRAPPGSKIYLRFLEYEMQNSNECKRNFVAVYDGSSSVEHLKRKFCSTVASDVMLLTAVGVVRMWADQGSRHSHFRILFTTFREPPCDRDTYFCHSNMCINHTLVCNGIQNCVYPWDENGCKEKRKATILETLDNTSMSIIGLTCGMVVLLLTVSILIQVKQPRKKYILRRDHFDAALLHESFEPPHYELCTLRSGAWAEAEVPPETPPETPPEVPPERVLLQQHTCSRCVHGHHCGSRASSIRGSRIDMSLHDATTIFTEMQTPPTSVPPPPPSVPPPPPPLLHYGGIVVMKHCYSQDDAEGACGLDSEREGGPAVPRVRAGLNRTVHRSTANDF
ncbi:neuropilin and tolloid-like protein 1 isoform X2 [Brachyhypopomus gauderio]|uniref:neuropilin and tolloid-like protein 1 isoform X2 n=1 Tax=Brachyhypopomus gauderio TaxID=698409 RepID=UPI0040424071